MDCPMLWRAERVMEQALAEHRMVYTVEAFDFPGKVVVLLHGHLGDWLAESRDALAVLRYAELMWRSAGVMVAYYFVAHDAMGRARAA